MNGGELVPAEDEPVLVDPPKQPTTIYATALTARTADRRPIVPAWARNRREAADLATWLARYGAHVALYHGTRTPKYAAKLTLRAPLGVCVAVVGVLGWVFDREAANLRLSSVARNDPDGYLKLSKQRNARVRQRGAAAGVGTAALGVLVTLVVAFGPWWAVWGIAVLAVAVLGKLGTPNDRRVTDPAVVNASAPPRLTADVVTRALTSLGIAAMNVKGATIAFPAPITRDGPGWRADVDLPFGVTVGDVAERRDRLASGLRRPLSAVWPEPSSEQHAGRLILWVGQPLNQVKPAAWPLAKTGRVDLMGGTFPFGVDQRQRPVLVSLAETNALIGSLPGGGKTSALRVLVLAAALDPNAELRIHEHKGTADLSALEKVAHRYGSGPDDATIGETIASLREVYAELERRAKVIARLPREVVPDSKVTPELAGKRSLGLYPIVMVIDEAQEVFSHPEYGDEAGRLCEAIIKRGRALAVILLLATQRPDSKSLPTGISTNVGMRFCLRVMDQVANDMVLGTSSYKNGIRATTFTPRDRGIGYLAGVGDDPLVVRTYYLDRVAAERIAERARQARERAGTLSGYCLGDDVPLTPAASLLEDLRTIFATATVTRIWSEDLCARLAELRPGVYDQLTPEALAAGLKGYGIETRQISRSVGGKRLNRHGLHAEQITAALGRGVAPEPLPVAAPLAARTAPDQGCSGVAGARPNLRKRGG